MDSKTINGVRLAYQLFGEGEPILFVHGFPITWKLWEHAVEPMRDAYRLIMPDLRGMGQSEATNGVTMATYADDLNALLDAVEVREPVVLVGLSMGGYVLFEFCRRYPDRVRALVLADTRAEADTPESAQNRRVTAERVLTEGTHVVVEQMIDKIMGPQASSELRETWQSIMNATDPKGVAAALHAMSERPDSTPTLAEIKVPTLVVVGEDDAITPPSSARKIHEGIAGAQLKLIRDAGHMPPVEQPDGFVRVLRQFVDALPRSAETDR
ncbi:MAG: alpha/beta hydrolase [Phycisphaerales bacterium]|nr:alpha/beta hydrolase [Phycisphaerales bacterium]